jgi:hypothetical protein
LLLSLVIVAVALLARGIIADEAGGAAPRASEAGSSVTATPRARHPLPQRERVEAPRGDPFGAVPVPRAPVVAAKPAAVPPPPPLPYRFAGVLHTEDGLQVFLAKGERMLRIKEGEALDGGYRVAAIGDGRIELVFEPLGSRQIIEVGPALALEAPRQRAPAGVANLHWEGPAQLQLGSDFSVALRLSYHRPLRSVPMQLRFEPGVLEPVSVRAGKFFEQGNFSYHVSAQGSIFIGASPGGAAPGADAELLVVTFKPVKAGATAALGMAALSLQGAAGGAVAHGAFADYRASIVP